MRIRTKLLVVQIGLIVIIGVILGFIATTNSSKALTESLEQQITEKTSDNLRYLEERFNRSFAELEGIASNEIIKSMELKEQKKYLSNQLEMMDYLTLAIVTPDGTAHYIDDTTADLGDRDYIIDAFNGNSAMSEIIISRATNEPVMMLSSPITDGSDIVGVLIARIDGFYLSEIIDEIAFGETGYAFMLNAEGTFLAHVNRELVEEQVNYTTEGGVNADTVNRLISEESGVFAYDYEGIKRFVAFDKLDNGWTLVVGAHDAEFTSSITNLKTIITIFVVITLLIGVAFAYFFANSISRPIQRVTENGKLLAEGDFTVHIDENYLQRTDEVGELSKTFETLTDSMRHMLHQVNDSTLEVERAVYDVTNQTEETAQIAEETNTIVSDVATAAEIQLESAKDSAVAMQEMATGTVRIAEIATDVSESSNEIHQQTNSGGKLLDLSVSQMQNIQEGTRKTSETMHKLEDTSREVNDITQIITDIADQTNLLALNASIEAARAGEAGSGFAVVADEIRNLSEQTASSALEINDLITNIQEETHVAVETVEISQKDVDQGMQFMKDLQTDFQAMFNYLDQINEQMNDLSALAEEMSAGTEEVSSAVDETMETTTRTTENIRAVEDKISTQSTMVQEIQASTRSLEETAKALKQSIAHFKV